MWNNLIKKAYENVFLKKKRFSWKIFKKIYIINDYIVYNFQKLGYNIIKGTHFKKINIINLWDKDFLINATI